MVPYRVIKIVGYLIQNNLLPQISLCNKHKILFKPLQNKILMLIIGFSNSNANMIVNISILLLRNNELLFMMVTILK